MSVDPAPFAALTSAFTWGVGSILFHRTLVREGPALTPAAANVYKNVLALGVFLLLLIPFATQFPDSDRFLDLFWSGCMGFAIGDTLFFNALPRCGVQTAAMVVQLNVPLAALFGFWFLDEALSLPLVLGIGVVMLGVSLVVLDGKAQGARGSAFGLGLLFALACAVAMAASVTLGHGSFAGVPVLEGTIVRVVGAIAGSVGIALLIDLLRPKSRGRSLRELTIPFRSRRMWPQLLVASGFASVLGLLPYHFALRELSGGIAAVLYATTPLFTLPLARLTGERYGFKTVAGTLTGFGGVAWILWQLQSV